SLKIHAVVNHVGDELSVGERLVGAAHDTKSDVVVAVFHESGDDGVEGALARGKRVGFGGIEHEKGTAILQDESHAADRNAGAEAGEVALDKRDDVAVLVDGGEIG